jgi:hypothetical protein
MVAVQSPRLVFRYPFDEAAAHDAEARGYLAYAAVELSDGIRYPVVFYDPVRLQQDLEVEVGEGRAFIAEPGMIVVPEVTLARMQETVERLFQMGFFDSLKGEPSPEQDKCPQAGTGEVQGGRIDAIPGTGPGPLVKPPGYGKGARAG